MKKYLLGIFAVVMAIGFSAFTNVKEKTVDHYYLDGATWKTVPSSITVCPSGSSTQCELEIAGQDELIYTQPNVSFPYIRN
jgi:hypothetical protein